MGGGHLSRPDFGMPQAGPGPPADRILSAAAARAGQGGRFPPACALCQLPGTGPAHLCRRGRWVPHPQRNGRRGCCSALCSPEPPAALQQPACGAEWLPRRPAAHRGVFPRCLRGAAAASLCLGGPAAAPAGCSCRSDPAIDPAGCGGHRHRPCCPCPPPVPDHPAEALAGPPQSRSVSCGENCPFPKALSLMQ